MSIRILVTGGTLDKVYNEINGELTFGQSHIEEMLKRGRYKSDVQIEPILMKDSLEMDDEDRKQIIKKCLDCNESKILITHGTDTMVDTGKVLMDSIKGKTVVLTGAMIPYSIKSSDALFNLGYAIAATQFLSAGIYIAMNGQIFPANNVCKDLDLGIFVRTNG